MPTLPKPIAKVGDRVTFLSRSLPAGSPIAQASLARDLDEASDEATASGSSSDTETSTLQLTTSGPGAAVDHSFTGSYRRPSFAAAGNRATIVPHQHREHERLFRQEREEVIEQERSLLRDNNIIPPKHPQDDQQHHNIISKHLTIPSIIPGGDRKVLRDEEAAGQPLDGPRALPSESTPLLGDPSLPYGGQDDPDIIKARWEEAVSAGKIQTTWQREAKVLVQYSAPLMVTFMLQYSLTVASIFAVGHIGTVELGAVSLASMTANITGFAIYQGLATSLDTLCAQAYGSGRKKLVGLQMQRMTYFLWAITIPIGIVWLLADKILKCIVPESEVAALAGLYLKVLLLGAPGFAAFEAGKRFVQAQGLFSASLYVLCFCAPLNALMNWLFVWKFRWGFVGAPIAVAITDNLLPLGLFIYVRFVSKKGMSCWNGFTRKAFHNWIPMIKLALPGLLMVEAEVLAFELLTFASSYFGVRALAAQSVLVTITSIAFQVPFPLSIAASTRIANLIGATLPNAAKTSAKVAGCGSIITGLFNLTILFSLRNVIPKLFTDNEDVTQLASAVLPVCAAFQLIDALATICNGILRGLGRQEVGGYVQVFCYYAVAMPISMGTAFGLGWGLWGLWSGVAVALGLVFGIEGIFLVRTSWENSVEEARRRNEGA